MFDAQGARQAEGHTGLNLILVEESIQVDTPRDQVARAEKSTPTTLQQKDGSANIPTAQLILPVPPGPEPIPGSGKTCCLPYEQKARKSGM